MSFTPRDSPIPPPESAAAQSLGLGERLLAGAIGDFSRPELKLFLQLFQSLPAAIYTTDAQGRITFFNEAAATLWGRRPVLGEESWSGAWKLFWPDGKAMRHEECPMALAIRNGEPVRGVEVVAVRPDGTRFPFIPYPTPLHNEAGMVIGAVNMLVDISERHRHEEMGEQLVAIVESSDDAIISKDLNGIIQSWNKGAQHLFGYTAEEIVGKSVTTLIPPGHEDEEAIILGRLRQGERIDHYETVRQRKDGSLLNVSLTVSPLRNTRGEIIGASKIAHDDTERKQSGARLSQQAQRLALLNQISKSISRGLDLEHTVQVVIDIATEVTGAKFGALFYNVADEKGEAYMLHALSGAPREAFDKFGMPRSTAVFSPTFHGGILRADDIRKDPRYGKNAPHHGTPEGHPLVVSFLSVPVIGRDGEVLGGLFFGHDQPGIFTQAAEDIVVDIASHAAIAIHNGRLHKEAQEEIIRRRRAEEAKALLLDEIQHRVKNTLGVVQAIATQTFRGATKDERRVFLARIQALAGAHDLLIHQDWAQAAVTDIVAHALAPFNERENGRFDVGGCEASLNADRSVLLAMILHELGTNAVKHGALSNESGRVSLHWLLTQDRQAPKLVLTWRESGGPLVRPPENKGFGSVLIERALEGQRGAARVDYVPEGLSCVLEIGL